MPSPPSDALTDCLRDLPRGPVCVAYSGGLDSTVLLHVLAGTPSARDRGLRAWHVHHGLQAQADAWAAHCQATCDRLGIALTVSRVPVRPAGDGIEAAARRARRAAFAAGLGNGETLALAHHRDDQAETFLLRALRASGPDALGAMPRWSTLGRGRLWRPLLDLPRGPLHTHAVQHGLAWIDDPSNADESFDRNFLRRRVLPLLRERWPQADAALAGSATLCAQAAGLLAEGDAQALARCATGDAHTLSRHALRSLPAARRARVLRGWIAALGLPPLPANGVERIESDLIDARGDAEARFAWHGAAVQAWRHVLHADVERPVLPVDWEMHWDVGSPLALPTGDELSLEHVDRNGASPSSVGGASAPTRSQDTGSHRAPVGAEAPPTGWRVHARRGGERITLPGRTHSHALKHVLQDAGIPPWERMRLPLLSHADGELLAAGDRIVSARLDAWLRGHGLRLYHHVAHRTGD
jgi:tRNA(Ile)-lysidine synthase